ELVLRPERPRRGRAAARGPPESAALGADVLGPGTGSTRTWLGQASYALCAVAGAWRECRADCCGRRRSERAGGRDVSQRGLRDVGQACCLRSISTSVKAVGQTSR